MLITSLLLAILTLQILLTVHHIDKFYKEKAFNKDLNIFYTLLSKMKSKKAKKSSNSKIYEYTFIWQEICLNELCKIHKRDRDTFNKYRGSRLR